jgi:hypothetical protein
MKTVSIWTSSITLENIGTSTERYGVPLFFHLSNKDIYSSEFIIFQVIKSLRYLNLGEVKVT